MATAGDNVQPLPARPFVAVIWAADSSFPEDARWLLIGRLLDAGCRYLVCGGEECELWHDEADWAWVDRDLAASETHPMVMTSWHAGESAGEVLWFAANNTSFDEYEFRDFVVVVVGTDGSAAGLIEQAVRAAFA